MAPLIRYSSSSENVEESQSLYNQAKDILDQLPQNTGNRQYNGDNQVVIELPMDYSFEIQERIYQKDIEMLSAERREAKELLERSSLLNNVDATYMLADINLYGNYSYPKNGSQALNYYKKVSELSPNSTAYFNLGFIYSTGLFGEVEKNQALANMYYNFAFELGDLRAGMVLGYRHLHGISVPMDCETALYYYRYVAQRLMEDFKNAPIGGPTIDSFSVRVADFQGGLYGKNVGESQSSLDRKSTRFEEILMGSSISSQEPEYASWYLKILTHYEGSYSRPKNYTKAFNLAHLASEKGLKELDFLTKLELGYLSRCIQALGHMYLRGEGVEQDFDEALRIFEIASKVFMLPSTNNDLGLLYEFGPDHLRNLSKAISYYQRGANGHNAAAKFNLGRIMRDSGNKKGFELIQSAAFAGHTEAVYHYARYLEDDENFDSCDRTVSSYKAFCEKIENVVSSLEWSFNELLSGRSQNALIGYAMAAEQGYETAQSSAAYILYQPPTLTEDPPIVPESRKEMALVYLTRSSRQYNVDSTVLMGDIYFSDKDYSKAAACYEAASSRASSHASWDLGWMYENGFGVEQDFHLAKRYYDLSLLGHPKAYIPVQLALLKLRLRSFINNVTGGKINSISNDKEARTWADWKALYKKVRNSGFIFFEDSNNEYESLDNLGHNSHNRDNEAIQDAEEILEGEDYLILIFFLIVFAIFLMLHLYTQRQMRQRRENGEIPPNRPNIEFDFRVIAI